MDTRPPASRPWRTIEAVHLAVFSFGLVALTTAVHSIVLPLKVLQVAPDDLKNTYLGLVAFAGLLVAILAQPVAGHVSDRTSTSWGRRRPFIVVGTVLAGLSLVGLGLTGSYVALIVAALALQLSSNVAQGPYQALLRDLVPSVRRGEASGVKVLAESLGGLGFIVALVVAAGTAGGQPSDPHLLWPAVLLPLAVLTGTLTWTVLAVREVPFAVPGATPAPPPPQDAGRPHPDFYWFLVSRLAVVTAVSVLQTYALFYLRDVLGQENPVASLGLVGLAAGGTLALGVLGAGRLSDRIGRRYLSAYAALGGAVGVLGLLAARDLVQLIAVGAFLGLAAGAFLSTNWALALDMVSRRWAARQLGIVNIATAGGSALAKLSGVGIDALNRQGDGLGYTAVLGMVALLFVVGAGLTLRVRPLSAEADGLVDAPGVQRPNL